MKRRRSPSPQSLRVLSALAEDPGIWRHGYDLSADVGLKSGSLYPILIRLAERGLLEATWEQAAPGKPPRHLYRITSAGLVELAQVQVAASVRRSATPNRRVREA